MNKMKLKFFVLIIFIFLPLQTWSLSLSAKQKYPTVLLTDDYGILNENDLGAYTWGIKHESFTPKENSHGFNYWQCFPRDHVSINIEDMGYSTEDYGWKDTLADITIKVWIKPGVFHQYEMRRVWPVSQSLKDFKRFHQLMKNEKYVCLAGNYVGLEKYENHGFKQEEYGWIFDKIKTKKGCASYFGDCDRTYEDYLKENKVS